MVGGLVEGFEGMSAEVNNKMEWGGREDGLRRRWVSGINMGSNVYGHMRGGIQAIPGMSCYLSEWYTVFRVYGKPS